jgi:hypothetical protein
MNIMKKTIFVGVGITAISLIVAAGLSKGIYMLSQSAGADDEDFE